MCNAASGTLDIFASLIYCCKTNHSQTWWLHTTIYDFSQFCGLAGLSREPLQLHVVTAEVTHLAAFSWDLSWDLSWGPNIPEDITLWCLSWSGWNGWGAGRASLSSWFSSYSWWLYSVLYLLPRCLTFCPQPFFPIQVQIPYSHQGYRLKKHMLSCFKHHHWICSCIVFVLLSKSLMYCFIIYVFTHPEKTVLFLFIYTEPSSAWSKTVVQYIFEERMGE